MSNKTTNFIAALLLIFMAVLAIGSITDDSLTMDELAHLPSGYSYLTQRDMRLNPEHPPLMKDLAGFPLLFIEGIKFPSEIKDWKEDVNGQWGFGNEFLFKTGNPADKMIFWGRIPMIALLILLGFYVFRWTRELFGNKAGLLSLFLYSFSPTLLAHGGLVTTDVAAAFGVVVATYYFVKFLKDSSKGNLIKAGVALGIAELLKFSLILLFPFFGLLVLVWAITKSLNFKEFLRIFFRYVGFYILIVIVSFAVIWAFYLYHTWNYPPEKQVADTGFILSSFGSGTLVNLVVWMADKPILKAIGHYFLGVFMILQRAAGGNTGFFLGEISAAGWKIYFPLVYAIKEPLAFHTLLIIALLYCAWLIKKPFWKEPIKRCHYWVKSHFAEFTMLGFIALYWATSLSSNLNIGVRHLLPVFPFTILLVSGITTIWLKSPFLKIKRALIIFLLLWQAYSVIAIYPHFLAYFNELIGRPERGYLYVTDSNLDWGQNLKRLKKWVDENKIDKIYVDYFGGADTEYYLKEKYAPWWGTRNPEELSKGSYLAVSATLLQGGRGEPVPGFNQPSGYYHWLDNYTPVEVIGNSIFVYQIK